MARFFEPSELIINPDGSIFHLHIKPEELGDYVLLVGDPKRVDLIASFFDTILYSASNREFYSISGMVGNTLVSALSTGIGTDNIDIVLNEIDALVNIDFKTRKKTERKRTLKLIRIGTSGAIQPGIEPGSYVVSQRVIGFDGLLNFYKDRKKVSNLQLEREFVEHSAWPETLAHPYCVDVDEDLLKNFGKDYLPGITISANGFYAPQGRELLAKLAYPELFEGLSAFRFGQERITNFEMECSALYGLSKILGHQAMTVCAIIANRSEKTFLGDYSQVMTALIQSVIDRIRNNG